MDMSMLFAIVLGTILLVWVLYGDFRRRIIKPVNAFKYYVAYTVFCAINVFLYLGLCSFMLGVDPVTALVQPDTISHVTFDAVQIVNPLIIAVMYHATGMLKFKVGNAEIDIYQRLLGAFEGIFALEYTEMSELQQAIEQAQTELDDIKQTISQLHQIGDQKGWVELKSRWAEIKNDQAVLQAQVEYLEEVQRKLQQPSQIDAIRNDIKARIRNLQDTQMDKLKRYLFEYTMKYMKSEAAIIKLIQDIGGEIRPQARSGNLVARTVVMCGMFGLLFGPIFAHFEHENILRHSWYGFIALGTFGLIFSSIRNAGRNFQDALVRAVLSGGAAGLAANAVWMLLRCLDHTQVCDFDFLRLLFGLEFGVVLGMVIYLFRNWIPLGTVVRSVLMMALGGVSFVVLGLLNNLHHSAQAPAEIAAVYLMLALIGVVSTIGVAVGLDVVKFPVEDRNEAIDPEVTQYGSTVHSA
jgi:hypothetical protein